MGTESSALTGGSRFAPQPPDWRSMAWRAAICAVAAACAWFFHDRIHSVSTACYMVAYLFGGWDLAQQTWQDFKGFRFDTHFLMLLVVPATAAIGAWGEGALLLVLFSGSAALEHFAMGRTHRAIGALLRGAPKTATVLLDSGPSELPIEEVVTGMQVRVSPGQQVPVDLLVETGESGCDESSLTGESLPVGKMPGDTALAGTLNLWGVIDGRALRPVQHSTLQRMIALIQHAQEMRAPSQRFADRFGTQYTFVVLLSCLALFLWSWLRLGMPFFFGSAGEPSAFYRAMTLLVVMSPCALVLSVPSAILSAIAFGARRGVLFRGGSAIEKLAAVDVVALDKTGTLTEGNLRVARIEVFRGTESDVFESAFPLARVSTHPLSRAVAAEARRRATADVTAEAVQDYPGQGIGGTVNGDHTVLGSRKFVLAAHDHPGFMPPPQPDDFSEVWVATPHRLGRILLQDTLRPDVRNLLDELHRDGVRTIMLTGDRLSAASGIAEACGVSEIRAELKPEEKVAAIQSLKSGDRVVAMIGDGVNDAPSLAAADVAVAMGARGSDAAIEQADVVLMHDRLENFFLARRLSQRARRVIQQNIALSIGTMAVMAVATIVSSQVPLSLGVLMHEGSTAIVVMNSLRLLLGNRSVKGDTSPMPS